GSAGEMRRGRRHDHGRARGRRGEDRPDVRAVRRARARDLPRGQACLRSQGTSQPRQSRANPGALRRSAQGARRARQSSPLLSIEAFQETIRGAAAKRTPLRLRGGGTKDFYGNAPRGEILDTRPHAGIVDYEASELVVTARCGTLLSDLEKTLSEKSQCLPF